MPRIMFMSKYHKLLSSRGKPWTIMSQITKMEKPKYKEWKSSFTTFYLFYIQPSPMSAETVTFPI